MDYLEILLQGYFNENNREHLERYFFREFKKAEKEHYEANEFFRGCLKVIEGWEKYLQQKVFERKSELYLMLNAANNGTLKHANLDNKTIDQKNQEIIDYCKQELESISISNFTVHLHSLTKGKVAYNMWNDEVQFIKSAILIAYEKIEKGDTKLQSQLIEDNQMHMQTSAQLISQTSEEAFKVYIENYQKLRERFRVKRKATKEDCKLFPGMKEGDIVEYEPEYETSSEAFALLKNYYATAYLELEKYFFVEKYKVWNKITIESEIQEIEKFIKKSNEESLSEASISFDKWGTDKPEFIFLRLNSGFYEHLEVERYPSISTIGNEEARIYGRFFLFYDFLKEKLKAYSQPAHIESLEELQRFFGIPEETRDYKPLKEYIRENYLNVHPNKFTLERLGQIKRNISTWKLKLKDLGEAPELQEFINEVIADIDLKIDRLRTNKEENKDKFSYIGKKESESVHSESPETFRKRNTELNRHGVQVILTEIKGSENKFWKGLPMEQVVSHFEVMTSRKSKNGNTFLTPEQLISFLKRGFLGDTTQSVQKINCSNGEKGFVIKRFYQLFDLAASKYSYPQNKKKKFISLFTDCFDNWEHGTIEPFFKPNKTKENW